MENDPIQLTTELAAQAEKEIDRAMLEYKTALEAYRSRVIEHYAIRLWAGDDITYHDKSDLKLQIQQVRTTAKKLREAKERHQSFLNLRKQLRASPDLLEKLQQDLEIQEATQH